MDEKNINNIVGGSALPLCHLDTMIDCWKLMVRMRMLVLMIDEECTNHFRSEFTNGNSFCFIDVSHDRANAQRSKTTWLQQVFLTLSAKTWSAEFKGVMSATEVVRAKMVMDLK